MKILNKILALLCALMIACSAVACAGDEAPTQILPGASTEAPTQTPTEIPTVENTEKITQATTETPTEAPTENVTDSPTEAPTEKPTEAPTEPAEIPALTHPVLNIPEYLCDITVEINGGVPSFTDNQIVADSYEHYSELDSLGRCGITVACLGKDLMPTDDRGSISHVTPTGWQSGGVYERAHLIGWQLAGENANKQNLVTGTCELNRAMLGFENMIADYIKETGNHVMYRVTPIFERNNLVCSGIWMEACSVEDGGEGISFNVYIHNVQSHYDIDYATGEFEFCLEDVTYVINKNNYKYHKPTCSSVSKMNEENKIYYYGTKEELEEDYPSATPCGSCKP